MAVLDENNIVLNMIVGDENSPTLEGTRLIEVLQHQYCNIGFLFDGQNFLDENGVAHFYEIDAQQ